MQFRESQAIYLQIADYVCERILLKEWKPGERVPSVRELAVQLEVNLNTVMRSYDFLQQQEIIQNQRASDILLRRKHSNRRFITGKMLSWKKNCHRSSAICTCWA